MKKLIILLAVMLLLPFSIIIKAQELQQSGTQLFIMGSGFTDDQFKGSFDAGIKLGIQGRVDKTAGIWGRLTYKQFNLTDRGDTTLYPADDSGKSSQSLGIEFIKDYFIGKKLTIYLLGGGDFYVDGPLQGTDYFFGLGVARRLWTLGGDNYKILPHLDAFFDIDFSDGSGQFRGNYVQLNIGLKFGKGEKL